MCTCMCGRWMNLSCLFVAFSFNVNLIRIAFKTSANWAKNRLKIHTKKRNRNKPDKRYSMGFFFCYWFKFFFLISIIIIFNFIFLLFLVLILFFVLYSVCAISTLSKREIASFNRIRKLIEVNCVWVLWFCSPRNFVSVIDR